MYSGHPSGPSQLAALQRWPVKPVVYSGLATPQDPAAHTVVRVCYRTPLNQQQKSNNKQQTNKQICINFIAVADLRSSCEESSASGRVPEISSAGSEGDLMGGLVTCLLPAPYVQGGLRRR